jgi:RluA family pseudouridine synthase
MLYSEIASSVRIIEPYTSKRPIRVKMAQNGYSVSQFMFERMPYRTQAFWEERIANGLITRNGTPLTIADTVKVGEELIHIIPAQIEPAVPDTIPILFEDDELLVVNKPSPLPIHAGGRYNRNSLVAILEERLDQKLYVIHRLDAVTEGIVVLAKNPATSAKWASAFQTNTIAKRYAALCKFDKDCLPDEGTKWSCDLAIGRYKSFVFCCNKQAQNPKSALTEFELVKKIDDQYGIVSCTPKSGRTHQIRLHCEAMGHPIVADTIYNGKSSLDEKVAKRQVWGIALQNQFIKNENSGHTYTLTTPLHWEEAVEFAAQFTE